MTKSLMWSKLFVVAVIDELMVSLFEPTKMKLSGDRGFLAVDLWYGHLKKDIS